ncbi:MAG: thioredoxin fold domain-containing protein [Bacteroidetes bacterium]|nr:thioredoxin fold domain-containing protein [Bacteroidota bacterium]
MKQIKPGIFIIITSGFLLIYSMNVYGQETGDSSPWISFDEMVESNQNQPKKIMLFMEADWCGICKRMKREVFPDPTIESILNNEFYPVRIDIESQEEIQFIDERVTKEELSKQFGIRGTPTIIFLDHDFSVIGNKVGFSDREELTALLNFISEDEYNQGSFEEYMQRHR